jgi:amino acid transporter
MIDDEDMNETNNTKKKIREAERTLGTFAGVFTPSILTILGIILYLRLGYVVGSAGLGRALIIITLATIISILTSISLAAISTNLFVKVGGYYYLISRTLGVEFGGAIGVVLFLAQSISIGFYCIGFGEAVSGILPFGFGYLPQLVAIVAIIFLFVFAWLGADWATRLQYIVMIIIGASLISFYIGGLLHFEGRTLVQNWSAPGRGPSFWILFAIFFPAVTGFSQGVSMSGDLKEPSKSLPRGTFLAVGISTVVYFTVAVVFAGAMPAGELSRDYEAMNRVATFSWLISAGVLAATISSAMASFLGAPRILQSLAQDRVFPYLLFFARGEGPTNNPRRGVLLSGLIALATVSLGKLNVIAPVVSMFFLISYGLLNYATFYEARARSPSFRPTFRFFDYRLSLVGAIGCLGVMVAIDTISSVVAVAVLFGIYEYLKQTAGPARWADSKRSYHFQLMRTNLFAIPDSPDHPRDWRPQILAFSDDPPRRQRLLCFASWIEGKSGITVAVRILEGKEKKIYKLRDEYEGEMRSDIATCGMEAFAKVIVVPDFHVGAQTLIQSFGIGPISPNTILLNGPEQVKGIAGQRKYGRYLNEAIRLGCNVIILNSEKDEWDSMKQLLPRDRLIDIWWRDDTTGRLMLLLAYLMTRTEEWNDAKIRVMIASSQKDAPEIRERYRKMLEELRIDAEPITVESVKIDTVAEQSKDAAMVFMPFHLDKRGPVGPHGIFLDTVFFRLPIVALVIAAEDIDLGAEPEEGKPAEIAAALDDAAGAERRAKKAEKDAAKLVESAEEKLRELEKMEEKAESPENRKELKKAIREARNIMKQALQEAAKAREKADEATLFARQLAGIPVEAEEAAKGEPVSVKNDKE